MGLDIFPKLTDQYERKARLYPAFLAVIPILALAIGIYGFEFKADALAVSISATLGGFYLFATIARELGKRLEESLFHQWGGKPTTLLLRHKDAKIDPVTKARYHSFLANKLGVIYPSKHDEVLDSVSADHLYASGVKWLLEKTRDKEAFALLFKENISYGFRRNCLGIKPLAIIITITVFIWVCIVYGVISLQGFSFEAIKTLPDNAWLVLGVSGFMLLIWLLFITKLTVKTAAFTYADTLFRACDVLP